MSIYNANVAVNSDECWKQAKDTHNMQIEKYALYYNDTAKENKNIGSLPSFSIDHINLRGRPGYGLSDDYLIDTYSSLRIDPNTMTRDRCNIQLETRMFAGGPRLTGQQGNINKELDILSGSNSKYVTTNNGNINLNQKCSKTIMEESMNNFIPLIDFVKEVQNPDNIIPSWTRGGDDTRSYVNKVKFSKCNNNIR
jgi:hypothetical protein